MATLVFDIETIGESWDDLDETTQHVLSRWAQRSARTPEDEQAYMKDLQEGLGFSPLTGSIVAIGLYDVERQRGVVYYVSESEASDEQEGEYLLKPRSEAQMLQDFWEGAMAYDTFVTFNGRCFDVPFMIHRSVVHGIRPTRDLMRGRYLYQQRDIRHVDLQDQLTFYGAMRRQASLHMFCRAYGIESPKGEGVSGDDVSQLYQAGEYKRIAQYNARDVTATTQLYQTYLDFLAPPEEAL